MIVPRLAASAGVRWLLLGVVAVLAACSGGGGSTSGPVEWRDMDLVVPDGWLVLEERGDLLLLANRDLRTDDIEATPNLPLDPDANDVVAAQFTTDATSADAWRGLIRSEDGTIEADEAIQVGGVPATAITFRWSTNGVDTRERVVIVPSRQLIILLQPVPIQGQTTGPEVYLEHVEEFAALLESIEFGAPEEY